MIRRSFVAAAAALVLLSPSPAGAEPSEVCYEQVERAEFRYAQDPVTLKRGKVLDGWRHDGSQWHQEAGWHLMADDLQPPHENTIAPTGTVSSPLYGLPPQAQNVAYRYDSVEITGAREWFPSEHGWTTEQKGAPWILVAERTVTVDGEEVPCEVPGTTLPPETTVPDTVPPTTQPDTSVPETSEPPVTDPPVTTVPESTTPTTTPISSTTEPALPTATTEPDVAVGPPPVPPSSPDVEVSVAPPPGIDSPVVAVAVDPAPEAVTVLPATGRSTLPGVVAAMVLLGAGGVLLRVARSRP